MPFVIPLIIGAAAGIGSSAIQAHQAGKAGDAPTDAANKALALQQQQYQQARTDAAPYQQLGQSTLGRLGQMAAQPQGQFNPANYRNGAPTTPQPQMPQLGGAAGAMGGAMGNLLQGGAQLGAGLAGQGAPMPGQQQVAAGAQGDTVTIQTPDGRTLQGFPRAKVQEAMQRGAKVVG